MQDKVYIVFKMVSAHENGDIDKIFTTREKALEYIEAYFSSKYFSQPVTTFSDPIMGGTYWWAVGGDALMIEEYEIDG